MINISWRITPCYFSSTGECTRSCTTHPSLIFLQGISCHYGTWWLEWDFLFAPMWTILTEYFILFLWKINFRHHINITPKNQTLKDRAISMVIWSLLGRYWPRRKVPCLRKTTKTHYCTQSVWAIALALNVAYYVFWLLISFRKLPW